MDQIVNIYINLVEKEIENGNYIEAENLYKKALQGCKTNEDIAVCYFARSGFYIKKGNKDQSLADLRKAADYGSADALETLKKYYDINYTPQRPSSSSGGSTTQPPKPVAPVATPKQSAPPPVVKPVSPPPNNKDTFEKAKALYNESKYEEAVFIFKSLAEQNHTEAMHFLAICYQFGRGIKKDAAKAEEWKEKRYKEESKKIWPNRK